MSTYTMTQEQQDRVRALEAELKECTDTLNGSVDSAAHAAAFRAWLEHLSTDDRQLVNIHLRHHIFPSFTESHENTKRAAAARVQRHTDDTASPIEVTMAGDEYPFGAAVTMPIGGPFGVDPGGVLEIDDGTTDEDDPPLRAAIREAYAAGRAHAAAQTATPGIKLNVVMNFADAARTFAYHGLRAAARQLQRLADRIAPSR